MLHFAPNMRRRLPAWTCALALAAILAISGAPRSNGDQSAQAVGPPKPIPIDKILVVDIAVYPGAPNDGFCSLDEAINGANSNTNADPTAATCSAEGSTGFDKIYFAIGT